MSDIDNKIKSLNIKFPVNSLTVLTGISGSGKSTLVNLILKVLLICKWE